MSASSILAAGASFLATQFPATINIAGTNYSASTSGLRTEQVMEVVQHPDTRRARGRPEQGRCTHARG
jgi:hypothetical protein